MMASPVLPNAIVSSTFACIDYMYTQSHSQ